MSSECDPPEGTTEDAAELGLTAAQVSALLDSIPGAWDDVERGRRQAAAGETIPLEEL